MKEYLFAESHEWIKEDGDCYIMGVSDFAQEQMGDVVYVEVPETGQTAGKGEGIAVVESAKSANEIYLPVAGEVTEVNTDLEDEPELVNSSPYDKGWILKFRAKDAPSGLLDFDAYTEHTGKEEQS